MLLVSITPYVPYRGAPYAGHIFYDRMARALGQLFDVVIVAPRTESNEEAIEHDIPARVILSEPLAAAPGSIAQFRRNRGVHLLDERVQLPSISDEVAELIAAATATEIQWGDCAPLTKRIRQLGRSDARLYTVLHDIVSTTLLNPLGRKPTVRDLGAHAIQRRLVARNEVKSLNLCDFYLSFKQADVNALAKAGVRSPGIVAHPSLDEPLGPRYEHLGRPEVLFVGALDRTENSRGVLWFLDQAWPLVVARVPDARLVVAGANPPAELEHRSSSHVAVTGYVDNLDALYRSASCVIAPIFYPGGIRFKVPQAMKYGLPVVATSEAMQGLEGLPSSAIFGPVNSATDFAGAVTTVLTDRSGADVVGQAARRWVEERFDLGRTISEVRDLILAKTPG